MQPSRPSHSRHATRERPARREKKSSAALIWVGVVAVVLLGGWYFLQLNSAKQRDLQEEGRAFCGTLVPRMEEFKEGAGFYPPSLAEVLRPSDQLPAILLDSNNRNEWYTREASGQGYQFLIRQQLGKNALFAPKATVYSSRTGRWSDLDE